ncbi:MAG: alpha-2-macroglobulin family protein [Gemmataceae bacterium]
MPQCEQYRAQLLEYLYDLVDDGERKALQDHLAQCAACQMALAQAKQQQQVIGSAAKKEFAGVRFVAPTEPPSIPLKKRNAPLRPASRRSWQRMALAASLLVALAGISGLGYKYGRDYLEKKHLVEENRFALLEARRDEGSLRQQMRQLPMQEREEVRELARKIDEQQINVVVSGPQTYQPGAPNAYKLQTISRANGQPVPSNLDIRVVDAKKNVVFGQKAASAGEYQLNLPPSLSLAPNSKLALEVNAHRQGEIKAEAKLESQLELSTPVYMTHLATDKPMYKPGEIVHFRSLTLDRATLKPAEEDFHLVYTIKSPDGQEKPILDGLTRLGDDKGKLLLGPDKKFLKGIGAGDWEISEGSAGGEYALTVREANNRFPEQARKFIVNKYERSRLNKELNFSRKTFGPGEEVVANCKAARAEGNSGIAKPIAVNASLNVDGIVYGVDGKANGPAFASTTDAQGKVAIRYKLPAAIERGEASLTVIFNDGDGPESLVRPVPIVVKKLQIDFYPEGGDLIAGVENRVYFQAKTLLGKPAEITGHLVDDDGQKIVDVIQTLNDNEHPGANQGMGLFAFTPEAGKKYRLKIDAPLGIQSRHELAAAKDDGVALRIPDGVTKSSDPLKVVLTSAQADHSLIVGVYCRGRLLDHQQVQARKGKETEVTLKPVASAGGVCRVTVFEEQAGEGPRKQIVPKAERLVYRQPADKLDLKIAADKKQYIPGDKVNLSFSGANEKGEAAPAVVMVSVVDKNVLTMADEKTAKTMPTQFYLASEVRKPEDLEYADFLLTSERNAKKALDLLLGTQGWRRFAEQNPADFRKNHPEDAERLLVSIGQSATKTVNLTEEARRKLQDSFAVKEEKLQEDLVQAQNRLQAAATDQTALAASVALQNYQAWIDKGRTILPYVGIGFLALGVIILAIGLVRRVMRTVPIGALATVAGALLLVANLWATKEAQNNEKPDIDIFALAHERSLEERQADLADNEKDAIKAPVKALEKGEVADGQPMPGGKERAEDMPRAFGGAVRFAPAPQAGLGGRGAGRPGNMPEGGKDAFDDKNKNGERLGFRRDLDVKREVKDQLRAARKAEPAKADAKGNFGEDKAKEAKQLAGEARLELAKRRGMINGIAGKPGAGMAADRTPLHAGVEMPQIRQRAAGGFGFGLRNEGLEQEVAPALPLPFIVREYAHQHIHGSETSLRSDFAETLYWQPVLVLPDGKATASFELSDSVTTFQVTAFGHTLDGRLGAVKMDVISKLPFVVEPKIPIEVTSSDKIAIPVSIANNSNEKRSVTINVAGQGLKLVGKGDDRLDVDADGRARRVYRFEPAIVEGQVEVQVTGKSDPLGSDSIVRTFRVVPEGFPINNVISEFLEGSATNKVLLPDSWLKGTLKCQVNVYPSTLADLQKGLEGLLREPNGCFEQTSTSNYPNLLILNYLKESDQAKPELEARARDLLARGYDKLLSFECLNQSKNTKEGYEWFGGAAPAHEALTAYGLLEFRDMAKVFPVDGKMLERTKTYLLSRKDGKGGFQRNPRALDTFGQAPENITNAYIVWSLTESGKEDNIEKELAALVEQAEESKDPYFLALVANSLINRSRIDQAAPMLKKLAGSQKNDGHLDAEKTSITGSGGRDLQIETTGLTVLAWLKANKPEYNLNVQKAVKWIGQQRGGYGGFGSTQSTILALKALIQFAKANKKTAEAGEMRLYVDEQQVAKLAFPAGAQDALTLDVPEPEKLLKAGTNNIRVEVTGKNAFPYSLSWSYQTLTPPSDDKAPVKLENQLDKTKVNEGETVRLTARIANASGKGQGMAVAILGLPAGLSLPENLEQLKRYVLVPSDGTKPVVSAFEIRGRELVLYWRDLAPEQKIEVPIDLTCRVPGEYRGPASRAYLYYNADVKCWVKPLEVSIAATGE